MVYEGRRNNAYGQTSTQKKTKRTQEMHEQDMQRREIQKPGGDWERQRQDCKRDSEKSHNEVVYWEKKKLVYREKTVESMGD